MRGLKHVRSQTEEFSYEPTARRLIDPRYRRHFADRHSTASSDVVTTSHHRQRSRRRSSCALVAQSQWLVGSQKRGRRGRS